MHKKYLSSVYFLIFLSFVIKLLAAYFIPVLADEAYYYVWSLQPQLSYFDHPPIISWLISISGLFFESPNPLSIRLMMVVVSTLTLLIWKKILEANHIESKNIHFILILFILNPLFGIGSILATPDVPLVFFWSLAYFCFNKILNSKNIKWYALLGVFLGLGFCSKYHIVLFVISGLLYILLTKKIKQLSVAGVLTTLITGFVFSLPVLIWNYQNNWASFGFQINHGFNEDGFSWNWPLNYALGQIALATPFLFYLLFKVKNSIAEKSFSLFQFVFFLFSSFKSTVEPNWPITAHLHTTANYSNLNNFQKTKYQKLIIGYWLLIYVLIAIFLFSPLSEKAKKAQVNSAQTTELAHLVQKYQPLFGPSYQVASLLSWQTGKLIPKLNELSRYDFYDTLSESIPNTNQFYVLKNDYTEWPIKYDHYKKIKLESFDKLGLELYQFNYE